MKKACFFLVTCILLALITAGGIACKKTATNGGDQSKKNGAEKEIDRSISSRVLKDLGIAKKPDSDVTMDVHHIYAPGISHLGSMAAILEAYDQRIVVTKVIFFSGPIYEDWQETKNGKKVDVTTPMRPSTIILSTLDNLGYRVYIGYNKTGFGQLKDAYLDDQERDRYQEFKNEKEAVNFLKRLLSSGYPVMVLIDKEFLGEESGREFVAVTGYNDENFFINDSSIEMDEGGKDRVVKTDDFLEAWSSGQVAKTPNLLFFLERVGEAKPDVEILAEIRKETRVISSYLKKDAERLKKDKLSVDDFHSFVNLSGAKRSALVIFLREKNFNDIAESYNQIAILYGEMREELDVEKGSKKLKEVAKEEKDASENWK